MARAHQPREIEVLPGGVGLRLDRYLARWFRHFSRAALARAIREGLVTDADDRPMRASRTVRIGDRIRVWIPELAAAEPPPPFPEILHEDDRVVALAKPAGMMCHPAGARFVWGLIGLCKERWPDRAIDLVHRLDADTSGVILLTKDVEANRRLKGHLHDEGTIKAYDAIVSGRPDWDALTLDGPIGPAGGEVRIQMAVRPDGLPSLTLATRGETRDSPIGPITLIHCRIRTGRTHQIRVHLSHAGLPLIGDRIYGPRPTLFLDRRDQGRTDALVAEAGAPRHALHARHIRVPHPDGGWLDVTCPWADDMRRWWDHPEVLPLDGADASDAA